MVTYLDDTKLVTYEQQMQTELRHVKTQLLSSQPPGNNVEHRTGHLCLVSSDNWPENLALFQHPENKPLVERFRSLEAALCQIQLGLFGVCSDCEAPIELERLDSDPTEQRCAACEARYTQRPKQSRVWL